MRKNEVLAQIKRFVEPYKIVSGRNFKLTDIDPGDTGSFDPDEGKVEAKGLLDAGVEWLAEQQDRLYAQDRYAMLLVFQAMDAAGKDGTIKHVMSGINPQGCQVYSFKQPSSEELDHDFMWRYARCLPERGRIGIYNRSYYEEVLVVRVHNELLKAQKLPEGYISKKIWKQRLQDIANFEEYLSRNAIVPLKFFLHVSKKEQKKRFLARLDLPEKHWKFSSADVRERQYWGSYMKAYEEAIRATASKEAPWFVVPADNKWYTRLVVAASIVDRMTRMDLAYPKVSTEKRAELEKAKQLLLKGDN